MTGSADTAGTHAVGAIFGDTIQTNTICATFCNTIQTNAISATFCNTVRANAISTIFGYAETLQSTLGTAFDDTVYAYAVSTIFGDDRSSGLLHGDLRQGESTGGQSGNNEAGEDLLFHVRSPDGGK